MMRKKICTFTSIFILVITVLCGCNIAGENSYIMKGDYPMYDTAQDIVDTADWVFSGKVKSIKYEMLNIRTETGKDSITGLEEPDLIPYTIYEIEPIHFYKGNTEDNTVYI